MNLKFGDEPTRICRGRDFVVIVARLADLGSNVIRGWDVEVVTEFRVSGAPLVDTDSDPVPMPFPEDEDRSLDTESKEVLFKRSAMSILE